MDGAALASAEELPLPNCNVCRRAPVTNRWYSSCLPCRDKRNESKRRTKEKKREQRMRAFQAITRDNIPTSSSSSQNVSAGKKRKVPEEESKADALERMRKRFKKMELVKAADVAPKPVSATHSETVFEKYVDDKNLYKAIKRRYPDSANSIRFYGTYAIIAIPNVNNKLKARQVARDLRSSTPLHFNLEDLEAYPDGTAYIVHYKCTCRAMPPRRASDLSAYFGSKSKPAVDETPKDACRGRIDIRVEDDRSHSKGWLGQRIKVTLNHPKM
ncbi:hypothetical protein MSAN_01570100 [Mycena sanguinolenta]|uniref:Uncharacterized protein n=1 Tax=Mycena sanguinolenta TaxID=230812 RepID=A0A8H7CUY0_9AGAR|nr:hypothetical protein MSAN_01570100 [Mycena sanguinolenta]